MRTVDQCLAEWSRRAPNDMDGKAGRPSERERASQKPSPTSIRGNNGLCASFWELDPRVSVELS